MRRGDIVLVFVPFVGTIGGKTRPAIVLQTDALNNAIRETIIAEITSNLSRVNVAHHVLIDVSTMDGAATGLLNDSAVRCERLHTIPQRDVVRTIGKCSTVIMQKVDQALKAAMGIV